MKFNPVCCLIVLFDYLKVGRPENSVIERVSAAVRESSCTRPNSVTYIPFVVLEDESCTSSAHPALLNCLWLLDGRIFSMARIGDVEVPEIEAAGESASPDRASPSRALFACPKTGSVLNC